MSNVGHKGGEGVVYLGDTFCDLDSPFIVMADEITIIAGRVNVRHINVIEILVYDIETEARNIKNGLEVKVQSISWFCLVDFYHSLYDI